MFLEVFIVSLIISIGLYVVLAGIYYYYKLPQSPNFSFFENILLGHRACRSPKFPVAENSLGAVKFVLDAHNTTVDGIECDIQLTEDNVPVVFHDTGNPSHRLCKPHPRPHLNGKPVTELTLEQVKELQFKQGPDTERIPTLEEWIKCIKKYGAEKRLMIEVKEVVKNAEMCQILIDAFAKFDLYKTAVVASFNPYILFLVRREDPRIVTNLLVDDNLVSHWFGVAEPNIKRLFKTYPLKIFNFEFISKNPMILQIMDQFLFASCLTYLPNFLGAGVLGVNQDLVANKSIDISNIFGRGYGINCWVVNKPAHKAGYRQGNDLMKRVAVTTDELFD